MLEIVQSFPSEEVVHGLAFTPDGTILASAGGNTDDFGIRLWDVPNAKSLGTLKGHSDIVWGLAFSTDGQMLASVSGDASAKIWDWRSRAILQSLDFPGEVASVSFSPDGQALAIGGVDAPQNQIRNAAVWTFGIGSWEPLVKFPEYWNITAMAYSPKGGTLVGGGTSRNVQVWNASDGARLFTLNHAHQVGKAAISPDGSTVATATCETVTNADCTEGAVWLWDLPSGRLLRKLTGFPNIVIDVAFSADGSTMVAATRSGILRFYSTSDYQPQFEFVPPGGVSALTLSPDGGLLATGAFNGETQIWKIVYRP
jgi:WD40 repeat protein